MKKIDAFSYACGVMDCFNEIVNTGVKQLALAHPCDTREQRDELLPYAQELCQKYGTHLYAEDEALLTDLFPVSLNRGKFNIVFYKDPACLDKYLSIKKSKAQLISAGAYYGDARLEIARQFGALLSYSEEAIQRLIANNIEKEEFPF